MKKAVSCIQRANFLVQSPRPMPHRKLALVFPGQGAQYVGMGLDVYKEFKAAKDVIGATVNNSKMNVKML